MYFYCNFTLLSDILLIKKQGKFKQTKANKKKQTKLTFKLYLRCSSEVYILKTEIGLVLRYIVDVLLSNFLHFV